MGTKNKLSLDNTVVLMGYRSDGNSLAKALDLSQGLEGISVKTQILIKPNLVFWDDSLPFPPYGILGLSPLPQTSHGEVQIEAPI